MKRSNNWWASTAMAIFLMLMVSVLGFMVLNTFIYPDIETRVTTADNAKVALEEKMDDAKRADSLILELSERIKKVIGGNEVENEKLSKGIDVPDLLAQIELSASKSGMSVEGIQIGGTGAYVKRPLVSASISGEALNIYTLELEIMVEGTYDNVHNFIKGFEETGYYVTVDSLSIARKESSIYNDFEGTLKIIIYSMISGGSNNAE